MISFICDHAIYTFLAIGSPCIIEIDNVAPVLKEKKTLFKPRISHSKEFFSAIQSKVYCPFLCVCVCVCVCVWGGEGGGNIGSSL